MRGIKTGEHWEEPECSTELPAIEAWLCKLFTARRCKLACWILLVTICGGALTALATFGIEVWRVTSTERALQDMQAEYAWTYETVYLSADAPPTWARENWAKRLGNPLVSDISLVKIDRGHPDDEQLQVVKNLREVRALKLRSDRATDKALEMISQLPNLRYLTLIGNNFSIMGLLKLRDAPCLMLLRVDAQRYSPIELAVLQQEMPGVQLLSARIDPDDYARDQHDDHTRRMNLEIAVN